MDSAAATQLRWLLLVIGIVIIVAIFLYTRYSDRKQRQTSREHRHSTATHDEITIEPATETDKVIVDAESDGENHEAEEATNPATQKVLILHIRAHSENQFLGNDIMTIAQQQRLVCGGNDTAGFFESPAKDAKPVFYITNMFKPGTFEWQQMDTFQTSGLTVFTRIPDSSPTLEIFRMMLECTRKFAVALGGTVLDEQHRELTDEVCRELENSLKADYLHQSQLRESP